MGKYLIFLQPTIMSWRAAYHLSRPLVDLYSKLRNLNRKSGASLSTQRKHCIQLRVRHGAIGPIDQHGTRAEKNDQRLTNILKSSSNTFILWWPHAIAASRCPQRHTISPGCKIPIPLTTIFTKFPHQKYLPYPFFLRPLKWLPLTSVAWAHSVGGAGSTSYAVFCQLGTVVVVPKLFPSGVQSYGNKDY